MKHLLSVLILTLTSATTILVAEVVPYIDNEALLKQLDETVEHKAEFQQRRHQRADSIRLTACSQQGYERIATLKEAYETYQRCLTDSVFCVLEDIRQTPEYALDSSLQVWTTICEARNYGVMGLYSSAFDLLRSIHRDRLDPVLQLLYYNTMHAVTGWMVDFSHKSASRISTTLADSASSYLNRVYELEKDTISSTLIYANILIEQGEYQQCIDTLLQVESSFDPSVVIYLYAVLAQAYEHLEMNEEAVRYLALTSIHDLQEGVTEYMALSILANHLQEQGQNERAYKYLICSLEDAATCHSSLRAIESTDIFPIIDNAYRREQQQLKQSQMLTLVLVFVCIGLIVFVIVFYLYQHIKQARSEVAQKKRYLEEMSYIAQHDELTGLLNRHGGREPIVHALKSRQPGYLGVLDIDFFKKVNDTFGHKVGDKVLCEVARCFDVMPLEIAARMGGDEFWLYTTAPLSEEEYRKQVDRFFDAIRAIRLPEMGNHRVSVSLGVVYYDGKEAKSFDDLYREADTRLYQSKKVLGCALTL